MKPTPCRTRLRRSPSRLRSLRRAASAERQRDVLPALVGVVNQPGSGRRRAKRHLERVDDEL